MWFLSLVYINLVLAQSFAYPVKCEQPQHCPSWVVGLSSPTAAESSESTVCSGSLVAPNLVLTNWHCLPKDLRVQGASCRDRIFFSFPKTTHWPEESSDCESVLSVAEVSAQKSTLHLDFAFLRLGKSLKRWPVPLSTAGISDLSEISIYKVDPIKSESGTLGVVRRTECKAVQRNLDNPYFLEDQSPLISLFGCETKNGNSGSGLVGSDGSLRGVVSSIKQFSFPLDLQKKYGVNTKELQTSQGTNLACIAFPSELQRGPLPSSCNIDIGDEAEKKIMNRLLQNEVDKAIADIKKKVNDKMKSIQVAGKRLFEWTAESMPLTAEDQAQGIAHRVGVRPVCFLPGISDLSPYKERLRRTSVNLKMRPSEFALRERLDSFLRYQVLVLEHEYELRAEFIPLDLLRGEWGDPTPVRLQKNFAQTSLASNARIPNCIQKRRSNLVPDGL